MIESSSMAEASSQPQPKERYRRRSANNRKILASFSGSGIGMLVGVLMGLAVSPTVGVIIGVLASSLALLLGLNDQHFGDAKALRIGAFGFACVAGAFLGIYIRSHNLLAPDLETQYQEYLEVGYTPEQARDFVAFTRFGILNPGWRMAAPTSAAPGDGGADLARRQTASVLFGARIDANDCQLLSQASEVSVFDNFLNLGGVWERLARAAEHYLEESTRPQALLAIKEGVCADGGDLRFKNCDRLAKLDERSELAEIRHAFAVAGPEWQRLADLVRQRIDSDDQATVLLILERNLCNEEKNG